MPVTSWCAPPAVTTPLRVVSERDADARVRVPLRDKQRPSDGAALAAWQRYICQLAAWQGHICQASRFQRPEHSCTA
jgi:hypothetical protein